MNFTSCKALDATITIDLSLVNLPCSLKRFGNFFLNSYVGDAGNTSLVDAGTPLGATAVVTPRSASYLLLGVLHPGVPVMWHGHIRDLSPTAEAVREAVCSM